MLTDSEKQWFGNLIDAHGTITIRIQSVLDQYVYLEPQIIILRNDPITLQIASQLVKKLTGKRPLVRVQPIGRLVIHGWKGCSAVLRELKPQFRQKRTHADLVLRLSDIHEKYGARKLLEIPSALELSHDLVELNRRSTRRSLLDIVIANALSRCPQNTL